MDSLTQLALGTAVGGATAGRQVGRRALLWGAVCGTFPDLDTFIPLGDAVSDFTYHRAASHSLFVLAALTPLFVWLILKLHPGTYANRWRWTANFYAVEREGKNIIMTDLRMGLEPRYVFRFIVGRAANPHARPVHPRRAETVRDWDRLPWLWTRIAGSRES